MEDNHEGDFEDTSHAEPNAQFHREHGSAVFRRNSAGHLHVVLEGPGGSKIGHVLSTDEVAQLQSLLA